MRETWERDICNSDVIFDLVPLFRSSHPACASFLSVRPRSSVQRVRRARTTLAWLPSTWLRNARWRTEVRVPASRSVTRKITDGLPGTRLPRDRPGEIRKFLDHVPRRRAAASECLLSRIRQNGNSILLGSLLMTMVRRVRSGKYGASRMRDHRAL